MICNQKFNLAKLKVYSVTMHCDNLIMQLNSK